MKTILSCLTIWLVAAVVVPGAAAPQATVTGRVVLVDPAKPASSAENSNAVIWLSPLNPGRASAANHRLRRHFRLVQQHKRFEPHVIVVPVGSMVDFPNLDPFFHNVFSLFEGKRFDLGLYEAGTSHTVNFDRPGISYIFCNIHPEMSAAVVAVNTPYYAISDSSGDLHIPHVPAGEYRAQVWHERCSQGLRILPLEIAPSESKHDLGTIRLPESADLLAHHKNKYDKDYIPPSPPNPLYE